MQYIKKRIPSSDFETKVKLFNSQCLSLYGWDYECKNFKRINIELRKCCRTHNNIIPKLMNSNPIEDIIFNRFIKFSLLIK